MQNNLNTLVVTPDGIKGYLGKRDYLRADAKDIAKLASVFSVEFAPVCGIQGAVAIRGNAVSATIALALDLALERCFGKRFEIKFEGDFEGSSIVH